MRLRDRLQQDLTTAMKSRDAVRTSVLRMVKSALKNREIETRCELEDDEVVRLLSSLVKQRRDSIEQFNRGGRRELAEKEAAEIGIIEEYLPATVSDEEIAAVVGEVLRETGAASLKDMGAVMRECMARFAGKPVDGKKVNALVRARLEPSSAP